MTNPTPIAPSTPVIRVLLVDDHAVVREGLRLLLEADDEGIQIVGESATTDDGMRAALALEPDVILVDLLLPGRPVPRFIEDVRSVLPSTRVLVLSAIADESWVRETLRAGASGYLLKSVGRAELVSAIRGVLAGRPVLHAEAQRYLLMGLTQPEKADPFAALSPREREILAQLALGRNNREISRTLYLSVGTVKGYVSSVLAKLGVSDRTQAAVFAVRAGILEREPQTAATTHPPRSEGPEPS